MGGLLLFIRKLRFAYGGCIGFTNGEYRIALVDFICSLRGHQRTKEKDSAEPLSSILWTPPPHPGGIRCGGAYLLPRAWDNLVSLYPVQIVNPHFDVVFGCFVFGLGLFAFQKISLGFGLSFFIGGG